MTRFTQAVNDTQGLSEEAWGEKRSLFQTIKSLNIKVGFKTSLKWPKCANVARICKSKHCSSVFVWSFCSFGYLTTPFLNAPTRVLKHDTFHLGEIEIIAYGVESMTYLFTWHGLLQKERNASLLIKPNDRPDICYLDSTGPEHLWASGEKNTKTHSWVNRRVTQAISKVYPIKMKLSLNILLWNIGVTKFY